jgi:hypothetical protein
MLTGQWGTPQAQAYWDAASSGQAAAPWPGFVPFGGTLPDDELSFLKQHAKTLADQIEAVNRRISELEKETTQSAGGDAK